MRHNGLVALQESIILAGESPASSPESILVFQVSSGFLGIEFAQVDSVSSCGQIAPVWSRQGVPEAVIGLCAASGSILTVIDGGLVFGANPVRITLKSRLITFGDGPLKGIALLVDRVTDPVVKADLPEGGDVALVNQMVIADKLKLGTVK